MAIITVSENNWIQLLNHLDGDITELHVSSRYSQIPQDFFDRLTRFGNLRRLILGFSQDSPQTTIDLRFLKSLALLDHLHISNMSMISIENLACCPLKTLALCQAFNGFEGEHLSTNLCFLEYCPLLENLFIEYTKIVCPEREQFQLSPLRHCPLLTHIKLYCCWVTSLEGIQNCPNLSSLSIPFNGLTEVERLADCPSLKRLELDANPIVSFNGIEFCQNLKYLGISYACFEASLMPLALIPEFSDLRIEMDQAWGLDREEDSYPERIHDELQFLTNKGVVVTDMPKIFTPHRL